MFRAEDIQVFRRGPLRVLTAPATKAASWCCDAGFSTAERYAELDHCGPSGLSRHSPSRRRSVNLALVQTEKIFPRLSCWHLAHPSASPKHLACRRHDHSFTRSLIPLHSVATSNLAINILCGGHIHFPGGSMYLH